MRYWFGASWADWTFGTGSQGVVYLTAGVTITFWNLATGGIRYTDLLDAEGRVIDAVVTGTGTGVPLGFLPRFQGPPDLMGMWADAGAGHRFWITTTDLAAALTALTQRVADLEILLGAQPARQFA
ncbi:hypothetical protein [Thermomonospora umbrina]|uniref:Uncharacterized protein n=1 Tax=Thermomonospora umbrina TaxID=111806 RepID=A0A3D9T2H7_9ACTN|nr:hypothetical protein [Thermomonospora umbrina]REF00564.1 hypothetical protein DFJ69_6114 [Thermomonospora umbrina]